MPDLFLPGLVAALVVAVIAVALFVRPRSGRPLPEAPSAPEERRPRAAIVMNPTKLDDIEQVRHRLTHIATAHGWGEPLWWETTQEDPGTGQTREALAAGADLVCALGGDGTVRSVAASLVDTGIPMGLLPGGTGNLLARNLGIPVDSLADAFATALRGTDRAIDIGRLAVGDPEDTQDKPKDYYFLVMAGLGFDAAVMAEAPEKLKAKVGWGAYFVSGIKHLDGPRFGIDIRFDGGRVHHRRVRSVIAGNVGRIQGGVELLPDAEADDGCLDVVLLAPEGIVGWAAVAARILTKRRRGHRRVEHRQCHTVRIRVDHHPQEVQLDGDPIGPASMLTLSVIPKAVTVRV